MYLVRVLYRLVEIVDEVTDGKYKNISEWYNYLLGKNSTKLGNLNWITGFQKIQKNIDETTIQEMATCMKLKNEDQKHKLTLKEEMGLNSKR